MHYKEKRYGVETDRPGDEVDKDHRKVIKELLDNQGWTYCLAKGGGYPRLYPPDPSQRSIRVPKTGHTKGYAFDNWLGQIKKAGGHWPPPRRKG